MALTKEQILDRLEILEDGTIQVRWATRVIDDDGTILGERYQRHVLSPGDDVSGEHLRIRRVANAIWDAQTIADYRAKRGRR
jgi:hypothetical protein